MFIKQLYTNCLSEAAYFIESSGEAAVVDPLRDVEEYMKLAEERHAQIKFIFESHFHADFVSGHLDLARKTGARIIYGPQTRTDFPIYQAEDREEFALGNLLIQVLHTPGHTVESSCYLLKDSCGQPYCLFTGDTLFIGDVGRPDLSSGNLSKEALASMLFDSLQRIKDLPDNVIIYPAHGPGSACGKNLGPETFSTLKAQKATNYALKAQSREEFIQLATEGLGTIPNYFPVNAKINRSGYVSLDELLIQADRELSPVAFKQWMKDALVLDTRQPQAFSEGFIPGSVNIGLDGRFAEWAGALLPFDRELLLVCDPGKERESIVRLARVGFDRIKGYLQGGFETWSKQAEPIDMIINVDPDELAMDIPFDQHLVILDVRKPSEYDQSHLKGARNLPLGTFLDPGGLASLEDHQNLYVHCQSGYRSVIACSLLKRQGFHNLRNVSGGFKELSRTPGIVLAKQKDAMA